MRWSTALLPQGRSPAQFRAQSHLQPPMNSSHRSSAPWHCRQANQPARPPAGARQEIKSTAAARDDRMWVLRASSNVPGHQRCGLIAGHGRRRLRKHLNGLLGTPQQQALPVPHHDVEAVARRQVRARHALNFVGRPGIKQAAEPRPPHAGPPSCRPRLSAHGYHGIGQQSARHENGDPPAVAYVWVHCARWVPLDRNAGWQAGVAARCNCTALRFLRAGRHGAQQPRGDR